MKLKSGDFSKPKVIIFAAPKNNVLNVLSDFVNYLKKRDWEILDVIMLGDTVKKKLFDKADLIITLGGDGTILYASRTLEGFNVPILGINFGKIGLLTELTLDEFYNYVNAIEKKMYRIVRAKRLVAQKGNGKKVYPSVLNEYALITSRPGKVIGLEIRVENETIARVISDGLIVSTPIGSSSYALSVGGPLLHEELDAIVLVPLAPLFRAMYPLVLPDKFVIEVIVSKKWSDAYLVGDGNVMDTINKGEAVIFRVTNNSTSFIRLKQQCYRIRRVMNLLTISRRVGSFEA